MADKKISALTGATTPLAGTEEVPVVQSGETRRVSVNNLTAGKAVGASSFAATGSVSAGGGAGSLSVAPSGSAVTIPNGLSLATGYGVSYFNTKNSSGSPVDLYQGCANWEGTGNQFVFKNQAGSTTYLTLASDANVTVNTGNLIFSAGKGIDFSATASGGTMTSELLADYEEGTFTAVLTPVGGGSITVASAFDTLGYIKIGRMVYVHGFTTISAINSPTGELRLDIPFTTNATSQVGERGSWGSGGVSVLESASGVANGFQIAWLDAKSYVSIYVATGNTFADAAPEMVGGNQTSLRFGFWYPAA